MSNDWFFEKFALISDAPGAVERMRGLVLSLAISGVLVEQREGDGHADELLADIIQEKIQRSKNLQTTDISTSASDNEQVFKIPNRLTKFFCLFPRYIFLYVYIFGLGKLPALLRWS